MIYNFLRDAAPVLKLEGSNNSIINTILFQKYRVLSLLGNGGSSSVYLAEHLKSHHYRAIKCIPKTLSRSASDYPEVSLLKNLRHPGIPIIYDIEEDETYFYIVEEYIQGESLSAFLQSQDNISQESVILIGIQLCEVIGYLHNQKPNSVLYLDLKPEHIILCGEHLKLIDFGIAATINKAGNQCKGFGTRGFAAPEQYTGQDCKKQTDVFGIGAVLYYMLTKENVSSFFKSSFTFPKYCSKYLKKIILKAAAPAIKQRYHNVEQLKEELQKVSSYRTGTKPDTRLLKKIIIAGSQERIGTTHVAIGLVCWLNYQGKAAVYQERKEKNSIPMWLSYKDGMTEKDGICSYQNFQGIYQQFSGTQAKKSHIFVQDYGANVASVAEEALSDLVILVIGSRPWEIHQGIKAYEKLSGEENLILICNYNDKQIAQKYAEIFQKKVFYFPLDQNPFAVTREKQRLFQQIINEGRET